MTAPMLQHWPGLFFFALFIAMMNGPLFAGGDISGGGGNSLVCFKNAAVAEEIRKDDGHLSQAHIDMAVSIEAYDLYEARLKRGLDQDAYLPQIIQLKENETALAYIDRIEKRFSYYVPAVSNLIMRSRSLLAAGNISYVNREIEKINDMGERGLIDPACVVATMARNQYRDGEHHLEIDQRLFGDKKHSELSRAVLLLHEFLYMASRREGYTSSNNTRELVIMLITQNDKLTIGKLMMDMMSLQFSDEFESGPWPSMRVKEALYDLADIYLKNTKDCRQLQGMVSDLIAGELEQDFAALPYGDAAYKNDMIDSVRAFGNELHANCQSSTDESIKELLAVALKKNDERMFVHDWILQQVIPLEISALNTAKKTVMRPWSADRRQDLIPNVVLPAGGEAMVCFSDPNLPQAVANNGGIIDDSMIAQITKVEMLDLYHARKMPGDILPMTADQTPAQYIDAVIARLSVSAPGLADVIIEERKELSANNIFQHQYGLYLVDDAAFGGELESEHCILATMSSNEILEGRRYLHVDQRLYQHQAHSPLSRAFMLLQQYVYIRALDREHIDSSQVRQLIAMMTNVGAVTTLELIQESVRSRIVLSMDQSYPVMLTRKIVDHLSEVARDTFTSLPLALSTVERAERVRNAVAAEYGLHRKKVLNIPGASLHSRNYLDYFLANYAQIFYQRALEAGPPQQVSASYFWDPYGPSKIHRFFNLNYPLPVLN